MLLYARETQDLKHMAQGILGARDKKKKVQEHRERSANRVLLSEGAPVLCLPSSPVQGSARLFYEATQAACRPERARALMLERCGFEHCCYLFQ